MRGRLSSGDSPPVRKKNGKIHGAGLGVFFEASAVGGFVEDKETSKTVVIPRVTTGLLLTCVVLQSKVMGLITPMTFHCVML